MHHRCIYLFLFLSACLPLYALEFRAGGEKGATSYQTLTQARDALREARVGQGALGESVTVWLHGGEYYLSESFVLGEDDGGTAEYPVVYRAVVGEEVRLIGGIRLSGDSFAPLKEDAALERLDADPSSTVGKANLLSCNMLPDRKECSATLFHSCPVP